MSKIARFSSPYPVRPWLLIIVAISGILFGSYFISTVEHYDGDGRSMELALRGEFESIPVPEKTHMVGAPKHVFKKSLASVSGDYLSSLDMAELKQHYSVKLGARGWVFSGDETTSGLSSYIRWFCKGDYEAYFEVSNQSWLTYSFGVRWNGGANVRASKCSRPA